jgi:signal transduction histidine kinase
MRSDRLVIGIRCTTLLVAVALAGSLGADPSKYGIILVVHAAWRTVRRINKQRSGALTVVIIDVALHVMVVMATGGALSPYVVALVGPIAAAAQARGLFHDAEERESIALGQLARLTEANSLLAELHRVAQTLPLSLDLRDTIEATTLRVQELFRPNVVVLWLYDDATRLWSVAKAIGARVPHAVSTDDLTPPLAAAALAPGAIFVADLATAGPSVGLRSSTGLYAPLRARDQLVGLLAVERIIPSSLHERDRELLDGIAEQAAMAIDNARWFGRLRRTGAEEERSRIARDLHDRVGQAIAYLAFELDRISVAAAGQPVERDLQTLRGDVRQILGEVRETLSDLRSDVTEEHDLVQTVETYLERIRRRTTADIAFEYEGQVRLPLPVEREMWRIAQEALTNAERHARAAHILVRWRCGDGGAFLEVADDGRGLATAAATKPGSYGIVGMRERADAIGAALEIDSTPGRGTTVRCRIEAA